MKVMTGKIIFRRCRSGDSGGAIYLLGSSHFSFNEVVSEITFESCSAVKGGALAIEEGSSMTFNSTFASDQKRINFDSNHASQDPKTGASGSAIYIKSSILTLRDAIVQNHQEMIPIQIDRGNHIEMENVQLMNNHAKDKGLGVIYC
jgi:hypothetical protein